MARKSIDTNFDRVYRAIERTIGTAQEETLFNGLLKVFRQDALRWEGAMVKSISGPLSLGAPKSPGDSLATRTGQAGLKGSFGTKIKHAGDIKSLESRKYSTSPYAVTHELGTRSAGGKVDLRPKRAKALTIPLPDAMTGSGVPRRPKARDWPDTFVFSTPEMTGDVLGFIVQENPSTPGDLIFLYLLFRGAPKIPARLGMAKTHKRQEKTRRKAFALAIGEAWREAGKKGKKGL